MASFSTLGIILCCVFGVIILCFFVAEVIYIFWWKKQLNNNKNTETEQQEHKNSSSFLFCCWKNPISVINFYSSTAEVLNSSTTHETEEEEDIESGRNSRETTILKEESVEAELFRLHNFCGPPRFLYTINEETTEDLLESEKSSRRRTLSDLINTTIDSPLITPPFDDLNHHHHGFNPLFESLSERELLNKLRCSSSSPPPKFKFLRDAEEKLKNRLQVEEAEKRGMKKSGIALLQDSVEEKDGSFITFLNIKKQREKENHLLLQQQVSVQNSASSKVLPLATSPSSV